MRKAKSMFWKNYKSSLVLLPILVLASCDLIKFRRDKPNNGDEREVVARVNNAYLYKDELAGIVSVGTIKEDSASRIQAYVNNWVRKQLLIQEATKRMDIDEAEIERKILDYRYSIIAHEFQTEFIRNNLDTAVSQALIQKYYEDNVDNFILKQNIVRATFIKVPKNAPRTDKIKELVFSKKERDEQELKSYCLSFSTAYHLVDSAWMVFDELVKTSPLVEIPNKIQFLKANPYYESSDDNFLYFLKVVEYRISDNISPLEFVKDEIKHIILNKRKVELANQLEDDVYNNAVENKEFEIY
jgi:hypothetical protein